MPTSNIVNDVNCSIFIIVHFCIPITRFSATWDSTQVCNDANLCCTFSSRRQITKHAQFFGIDTFVPTSQFAFFMVFNVFTLILSIKCRFLISSHATSSLEDISKRDFIKTSNTTVTVELVCVAYFNSLSILSIESIAKILL